MACYIDPETHAANPPETWTVQKRGQRGWALVDREGTVLESTTTKRDALAAIETGTFRRAYDAEGRWYAGETPPGRKSWAECKAERERAAARRAARASEPAA